MPKDTLTIIDNRTGKQYEIPIELGTIRAMDLRQIKTGPDDFGLMTYDPAFTNTASCKSRVTFIDGDKGILRYRGYPIEQLAEKSTYLETAYLIVKGELPDRQHLEMWDHNITIHTMVHENIKKFMDGFRYDAHPMGILISSVAALSTFYPDSRNVRDAETRRVCIYRLIGKMPIIAAYAYRHRMGLPYIYPDPDLSYTANFMNMLWKRSELKYLANPVLARALDVLFILHADHEQNCSANAMRSVGSSLADPYVSVAAAAAALYGPLHGGANEEVLRMLKEIGSIDRVPAFIKSVKEGHGKLMGFGHRVYKNFDPRAKIIKKVCDEVLQVLDIHDPLLDIARELEDAALTDPYFVERKLYPNVDFYSGIIMKAIGIPVNMFTVMFSMGRMPGWVAHWKEVQENPKQRIYRPRQVYQGEPLRQYMQIKNRKETAALA
jgi:citrate synthase